MLLLWRCLCLFNTTNTLCQTCFAIPSGVLEAGEEYYISSFVYILPKGNAAWINIIFPLSLVLWSLESTFQPETINYHRSGKNLPQILFRLVGEELEMLLCHLLRQNRLQKCLHITHSLSQTFSESYDSKFITFIPSFCFKIFYLRANKLPW